MVDKQLAFSLNEYRDRLQKVRERMERQGIAALVTHTPENIFYLTGYQTPGYYKYQCCIVPLEAEPIMVVRRFEKFNVDLFSWIEQCVIYDDTQDHMALTQKVLLEAGLGNKTIGIEKEAWFLTMKDAERLIVSLPEATFVDGSGVIEGVRLVKSAQEIAYIRQAARAVEQAMQAGIAAAQVGNTEDDVAGEVWKGLVHGSSYPGFAPFVCSGPRTAWPHATWAGRKLEPGDVVFLEIGGCVQRYGAAMVRCGVLGKPTAQVASMAEACAHALAEATAAMWAGNTSEAVNAACQRAFEEAGWGGVHQHRAAYSIGVGFPPDWGEGHIMSLEAGDLTELQVGMVFHVVPTLLVPTVAGIACTDTVMVTENGGVALTDFDHRLFCT
jgi:Xaa-Pro dipeptidase